MQKILSSLLIVLLAVSCGKKEQQQTIVTSSNYVVQYAQGFKVIKADSYTHITVRNPWDTTNLLQSYVLVDKKKEIPANLPKGVLVRTPLTSVAATSVIHCTTLRELGSLQLIKGICEPQYVNINDIQTGVADGEIVNLGMASNPNNEALIMLNPDVIFSDPVAGQSQASMEKTKLPLIQTPDYTEPHPLGRAEWIRFYSLFIDKESLADSLFLSTVQRYNDVKEVVKENGNFPSVFTDTRYQGNWSMPGGQSYMANLLTDAGSNYLWSDTESTTFLPLSFESVLDKAENADTWIIKYFAEKDMTYADLEKEYKPYSYFQAFKQKNIYACNTKYSDYFEDLPIHPDYILKDLAYIFHPELFPDYSPKYYKKLIE